MHGRRSVTKLEANCAAGAPAAHESLYDKAYSKDNFHSSTASTGRTGHERK